MIRHMTIGQLRICIAVVCIFFIWTTAKYMSHNLPNPTRKMDQNSEPSENREGNVIKVEVFYECLCPDSRSFFLTQLVPAYKKLSNYVDLRLIPYGKAQTIHDQGVTRFKCQHGPTECEGNMVHACTIDVARNQSTTLNIAACMINDNTNPEQAGKMCTQKYDAPKWPQILQCFKGQRGIDLLVTAGEETDSLGGIHFVPTIRLQGSTDRQNYILKNLFLEICRAFDIHFPGKPKPPVCPKEANL